MADDDPPTLLLVEDDAQLLELYCHFLGDSYDLRTASSGAEALDEIDESVDLVLLDRRMPEMSGDEVLGELRARDFDCPVAMVTAVDPNLDIVDLEFDDYVVKPVSRGDLEDLVASVLCRQAYDAAIREYFALGSKVAALEADHSLAELAESEKYRDLIRRVAAAKEEAGAALSALSPDEVDALFRDLEGPAFRAPELDDDRLER